MIDEATKGKHCNDSCCDYYCPQNVSGRCQAPNKCLGVEEAAELMAELEAAKREIAALRKRERGDCAKLREALKRIVAASIVAKNANAPEWILQRMADVFAMATTALAAPPRNCDVGTASEQEDRFAKYCRGSNCCAVCPIRKSWDFKNGRRPSCAILWAQMPYEEGGAE